MKRMDFNLTIKKQQKIWPHNLSMWLVHGCSHMTASAELAFNFIGIFSIENEKTALITSNAVRLQI